MLEALFGAIAVALLLIGMIALTYAVLLRILVPKQKYEYYIVIPSHHCSNDVTSAVYAARMKMNLIGDENYGKVLLVDTGMNEAEKLTCLNVCREENGIYLMTPEELEDYLK